MVGVPVFSSRISNGDVALRDDIPDGCKEEYPYNRPNRLKCAQAAIANDYMEVTCIWIIVCNRSRMFPYDHPIIGEQRSGLTSRGVLQDNSVAMVIFHCF